MKVYATIVKYDAGEDFNTLNIFADINDAEAHKEFLDSNLQGFGEVLIKEMEVQ